MERLRGKTRMKYFILCPYCNKTYIIDGENQTAFTCPNCGASNKYSDIIRTEDDAEKIRQAAEDLVREQEEDAFRYFRGKQEEKRSPFSFSDSDDSSEDHNSHNDTESSQGALLIIAVIGIFLFLIFAYTLPTAGNHGSALDDDYRTKAKEISQKLEGNGNKSAESAKIRALMDKVAYFVSFGYTEGLIDCLYGAENYTFISSADWKDFFKDYFGEYWADLDFRYTEVTYVSGWPVPDNPFISFSVDLEPYQIFEVKDSGGKLHRYTFYQDESGEWRLFLDYSDLLAPSCKETLPEIWNAVKEAALDYADASAIRNYFTYDITGNKLDDLLRYVRFSLAEREPYAGAVLTALETSCSMDHSPDHKFKITVTAEYQSQSPDHPAGSYSSKIQLQYTDTGWKIYTLPDYTFFTIEQTKN